MNPQPNNTQQAVVENINIVSQQTSSPQQQQQATTLPVLANEQEHNQLLHTTNNEAAKRLLNQLGSTHGIMRKENLKFIFKLLESMKLSGCNSDNNPNYKLLNDFLKQQLVMISKIQHTSVIKRKKETD
jgi:hypothetical protein